MPALRLLAISPDSVSAHYNAGRILAARGETDAALKEFDAVIRLAPHDEDALLARAKLLARRERFAATPSPRLPAPSGALPP